ncbi:MAG: hypothetical protein JWN56_2446 [Sphingobacteriales bacterium]|nr:hypothetical protein [Sphingobacteriales bacterium]
MIVKLGVSTYRYTDLLFYEWFIKRASEGRVTFTDADRNGYRKLILLERSLHTNGGKQYAKQLALITNNMTEAVDRMLALNPETRELVSLEIIKDRLTRAYNTTEVIAILRYAFRRLEVI